MVMEPTDFRDSDHLTPVRSVHWARLGTIHRQRQMGPPVMVVGKIVCEDTREMPFMQDHYVIQALSTDTPDQALDIWVLPRTPGRNHDLFDAHMLHPLPKHSAVDTIAVAQQIPRRLVPGKRLDHLLCRPHRRRMLGDVEVHHTAALVGQDDEHKEHLVRHGRSDKEIHRDHVTYMGLQKCLPRRPWWRP